jgi:hypothetical protein
VAAGCPARLRVVDGCGFVFRLGILLRRASSAADIKGLVGV